MKRYVEKNLAKGESIVVMGERSGSGIIGTWVGFAIRVAIWVAICCALAYVLSLVNTIDTEVQKVKDDPVSIVENIELDETADVGEQLKSSVKSTVEKVDEESKEGMGAFLPSVMLPDLGKVAEKDIGAIASLFLFVVFLLWPLIKTIAKTISYYNTEIAITSRRIVGKTGTFSTKTVDASIEKVDNCEVTQPLLGKIFNYSTIEISVGSKTMEFPYLKNAESFKTEINNQLEALNQRRAAEQAKMQAEEMAKVMAAAANMNNNK